MVKKLNPSFVEYFAGYLKKLLSDKKKNNETISAEMFQEQVTNAANVYLNENYGADPSAARAAIAQSAPEAECAKAINARNLHGIGENVSISHYKTQSRIDTETNAETLKAAIIAYAEGNPVNTRALTVTWISKTNMLLPDATGRKKQQAVEFIPDTAAYCGKCWICMTDVMSYSGPSNQLYDDNDNQVAPDTQDAKQLHGKTPCGDCEHVSAIMASYIAGMLTSGRFAEFYWASYYVACVECNRRKSNYIGVKLSATKGWQVDDSGVNAIVDAIFPMNGVEPHASEYNPIRNALSDKYNGMTPGEKRRFRDEVKVYIESGTKTWCKAANDKMGNMTEKTKHIKMSFNVSKIIVAITGHLNVITGPLQKRANKAVKAGRTQVKPKIGKKRGGGPDDDDDDMEGTDTDGTQPTGEGAQLKPEDMAKKEGEMVDDPMIVETDVKDTPILHWYNLIGEAEVDADYDDEDDEEDDRETDAAFNARIVKYSDVILEYIGNKYSRLLFKQYESAPDIFEELMVNLSNSMHDILPDLDHTKLAEGEQTVFELGKGEKKDSKEQEPDSKRTRKEPVASEAASESQLKTTSASSVDSTPAGAKMNIDGNESTDATTGNAETDRDLGKDFSQGFGGSRLNKRHSKNKTKRISYIKHKQTRKNQHSRKTK